ncbi:hypothetical protein K439DRAFT_1636568 [Ramaria rubella]|nr:hypothetical protein K439DRAFT_1636568 [Ramaria rubella]
MRVGSTVAGMVGWRWRRMCWCDGVANGCANATPGTGQDDQAGRMEDGCADAAGVIDWQWLRLRVWLLVVAPSG